MLFEWQKCARHGIGFNRRYAPFHFLEGKKDSPIWIVGLNPRGAPAKDDQRSSEELECYFERDIHSYYNDFKMVSRRLYGLLGKDRGVAHIDIVKCYSNEFPPKGCGIKDAQAIIDNCREYFDRQIKEFTSKIIICNGSPVCRVVKSIIGPLKGDNLTSYIGELNGNEAAIVLSGFVGRLDNYAKLRLGREIEFFMERYKLGN